MEVPKEIIRPGTYTYLNPDGMPERMTVTADTIKHFHAQGNAMLADNLAIPVPLEHQPDAKVQTPAEKAAHQLVNNAGFVKKYEIRKIDNEDRLFGILDIPDKAILSKLPTTIRSVSPWINSFTDGNGKRWEGVISHVALTTRPRIAKQEPFASAGAAMSLVSSLTDKVLTPQNTGSGIGLSSAGLLSKVGDVFKPKFPIAFSLMAGIKLSEDDLENLEDDDEDADGDADAKPEGDAMAGEVAKDDTMAGMDAEAGDVSFEELIPHLLELHGIHVPAGGKGKEFLQALVQGLLTSAKSMAANDGGANDNVLGDDPAANPAADPSKPKGPIKQESPPMYMSMEQIEKITDPEKKQMATMLFSLQSETQSLRKNKLDEATQQRNDRIGRIAKAVSAKNRDKILQVAASAGAQLSLVDGVVVDPMKTMLDIFEDELHGMPELLKKDAKFSVQAQPSDDGTLSDADAEKLANQMVSRGRPVTAA